MNLYWYRFKKPSPNFRQVFSAVSVINVLACSDSQIVFHIQGNLQLKQQIPLKINLHGLCFLEIPEVADNIWTLNFLVSHILRSSRNQPAPLTAKTKLVITVCNYQLLFYRLKSDNQMLNMFNPHCFVFCVIPKCSSYKVSSMSFVIVR